MKVNIGKYKKTRDRTVKVEIDEKNDTYSLDHTLALVILPALKVFKPICLRTGMWGCLFPDDYDSLNKAEKKKIEKKVTKEMGQILDKMILAFQLIVDGDDLGHRDEIQEGLDLFAQYYMNLWW